MQLYDPRHGKLEHPGTFNNNAFTMGAGIAGCGLLTAEKLAALNALGVSMTKKIQDVLSNKRILEGTTIPSAPVTDEMHSVDHPHRPPRMFIKGVGSLMAIQFAGPGREVLQGLFYHHMLQQGIYMAQRGFIALNIMLTEEHVALFVRALEAFVDKWEQVLKW